MLCTAADYIICETANNEQPGVMLVKCCETGVWQCKRVSSLWKLYQSYTAGQRSFTSAHDQTRSYHANINIARSAALVLRIGNTDGTLKDHQNYNPSYREHKCLSQSLKIMYSKLQLLDKSGITNDIWMRPLGTMNVWIFLNNKEVDWLTLNLYLRWKYHLHVQSAQVSWCVDT